jgi:integrase
MSEPRLVDITGRMRSPAATPGHWAGCVPPNKGHRYPADPPTVEEIILVMRQAGPGPYADRTRGLIAILWRAGLRISEALALIETDLDAKTGSVLVRQGKGGRRKRWWRSKQLGLDEDTVNDYQWRLGYLERFFGRYRLRELTPQLVDRFRDELHEQAETIRRAQERARTEKGRRPLMETITDKRRPHVRAPAPAALEHFDQRDDHVARADPAAGARL